MDVFRLYVEHLPREGVLLDWGCFHAPDACLVRHAPGDGLRMHGCDRLSAPGCRPFHEYAGLRFTPIEHPYRLPYDDATFDAVIGSGVLEHVPHDAESLKELYRVLRVDGTLVLTFLPNRCSYTEWCCRRLGWPHHRRLYTRRVIRDLLLHHGFEPILARHHQFIPAHRGHILFDRLYGLNGLLERLWLTRLLSANLMIVGRKRVTM